ncbi:MAG: HU family DNA-binding protein [Gammaproteobacteria bacterium]|nr:HU family DNA-binding protein [Gammaproteobacteria bacterium]
MRVLTRLASACIQTVRVPGKSARLCFTAVTIFLHHADPRGDTNVNKTELIDKVAESTDLSKAAATRAVEAVLDAITGSLHSGDTITLSGFGTFSVSNRAARTGRNPRTGEAIAIAASKSPKFKAGKGLKDAVN